MKILRMIVDLTYDEDAWDVDGEAWSYDEVLTGKLLLVSTQQDLDGDTVGQIKVVEVIEPFRDRAIADGIILCLKGAV